MTCRSIVELSRSIYLWVKLCNESFRDSIYHKIVQCEPFSLCCGPFELWGRGPPSSRNLPALLSEEVEFLHTFKKSLSSPGVASTSFNMFKKNLICTPPTESAPMP